MWVSPLQGLGYFVGRYSRAFSPVYHMTGFQPEDGNVFRDNLMTGFQSQDDNVFRGNPMHGLKARQVKARGEAPGEIGIVKTISAL
jgi:hypothetical protein